MPRKANYWTRQLELDLVAFVRDRDYIWRPIGNTNHHIQQKYKAYAEFAARLGRGFTARSVRDRWVNIRSTFNHNLRKIEKTRANAKTTEEIFNPCWPLWKPLQFLIEVYKKDESIFESYDPVPDSQEEPPRSLEVKQEQNSEEENDLELKISERRRRTDRPRRRKKLLRKSHNKTKCKMVIDELLLAMKPLTSEQLPDQSYWFFGKHIAESLNCMRKVDAESAYNDIMNLLNRCQPSAPL